MVGRINPLTDPGTVVRSVIRRDFRIHVRERLILSIWVVCGGTDTVSSSLGVFGLTNALVVAEFVLPYVADLVTHDDAAAALAARDRH